MVEIGSADCFQLFGIVNAAVVVAVFLDLLYTIGLSWLCCRSMNGMWYLSSLNKKQQILLCRTKVVSVSVYYTHYLSIAIYFFLLVHLVAIQTYITHIRQWISICKKTKKNSCFRWYYFIFLLSFYYIRSFGWFTYATSRKWIDATFIQ